MKTVMRLLCLHITAIPLVTQRDKSRRIRLSFYLWPVCEYTGGMDIAPVIRLRDLKKAHVVSEREPGLRRRLDSDSRPGLLSQFGVLTGEGAIR
jgi:hypothetical protein